VGTRLRLSDGVDLTVDIPLNDVVKQVHEAKQENRLLTIDVAGTSFALNPEYVVYLEEVEVPNGLGLRQASKNGRRAPVGRIPEPAGR
jgi:hypothetical protein